ncbi:LysM peptidoglycan-binding domain-containing protein [Streptomyces sp. NPDC048430]|uniref:LysM peptidoglycan-binding domain-containing protein n=1 Tax=Streptomyces sp. NPDC048430 TaxID=3155388 RepID=UPI003413DAC9
MAHRTPTPVRALGALLGLALLVALVAGVPYLLLAVGHQPTELTGGTDLLMQQDDGSLFLVVLTCLGWAGWAAFTFSTLLEIVAVLRRRSAPRIKGLGGLQSLASFLIGGIVLLAPTAASAATVAPAVAAVQTASETPSAATPSTKATKAADWPEHTVATATELPWDLAEEYLGDGTRWKDIAALNPDIPQLAAGDQFLPKGAVVKLPADARPIEPAASTTPTANESPAGTDHAAQNDGPDESRSEAKAGEVQEKSVTVRSGDSLWSIADDHGDPDSWPAIFAANKGESTPDGKTFDNPNLIFPGQELDLPQAAGQPDKPTTPDKSTNDLTTPDTATDPGADTPADTPDKEADGNLEAQPSAPAPAPAATTPPAPAQSNPAPAPGAQDSSSEHAPERDNGDQSLAPAAVWMGAGALAAALVGTLTTRRILQQRRRRPGRRIPMPQGRAAATEQGLRAAQHPTGFDLLSTALRTLALNLTAAGRELPTLEAVVLHETKVELHLSGDTAPMKPFHAAAGRQDLWICPASSPDLADEDTLKDADAPYPALVSIGWDVSGHLVLIDLEHIGVLHLAGDPDAAREVLQAIAVELASTPLPDHIEVTALAETAPGLDHAAPERVARIHDLTDATAELVSHTADQRRALAAVGASSLRAARLMDDAGGAWTPHILLATELPDEDPALTTLFDTLTQAPRAASAVVTSSTTTTPDHAWTMDCGGSDQTIVLPGSNLPIKLQGLSDEHFADAIELLRIAASDADVPAQDWTPIDDLREEKQHEDDPEGTTTSTAGAQPDEDGLPQEYAEEEDALGDHSAHPNAAPDTPSGPAEPKSPSTADQATASGPSLAEILAEDGEAPQPAAEQKPNTGPAADPGNVALALASPCAALTPAAVHVTIPAPAAEAEPDSTPTPPHEHQDTTEPAAPEDIDEPLPNAAAPAVLLLGPIGIEGATGRIDSNRRSIGTELVAYLALNPGADHHAVDDALWPGRLVNKQMRNAVISRTRSWLGKDHDGNAHLPRVQDTGDSRYRLSPAVTCDWTQFQHFARTGLARHDEDGDLALRRALALVRGRPFTGIAPQRYAWAEPVIQEMVSALVDVAYELSTRRREGNDIPGALWAARRGLLAAEESEMLHRQLFLAHHAAGDLDALREAATHLTRINEQLLGGVDMEAETAELLRNLLPRPVTRAR